MILELLRLVRVRQWPKNFFCFAALFFGGKVFEPDLLLRSVWVFAGFCCFSGVVYILNDYCDREEDRSHPVKRNRPLAKGTVGTGVAWAAAAVLLVAGFAFLLASGQEDLRRAAMVGGIYLFLNVLYSLKLKSIPLLDINVIALGFVLRVVAGAVGIGVEATAWILVCTYFLTLLIAIGKRRSEVARVAAEGGGGHGSGTAAPDGARKVLSGYTVGILDTYGAVCGGLVVAFYSIYCVTSRDELLITLTVIPAAMGVFRFLGLMRTAEDMEAPEDVILKDVGMGVIALVWLALFTYAVYVQGSVVRA